MSPPCLLLSLKLKFYWTFFFFKMQRILFNILLLLIFLTLGTKAIIKITIKRQTLKYKVEILTTTIKNRVFPLPWALVSGRWCGCILGRRNDEVKWMNWLYIFFITIVSKHQQQSIQPTATTTTNLNKIV